MLADLPLQGSASGKGMPTQGGDREDAVVRVSSRQGCAKVARDPLTHGRIRAIELDRANQPSTAADTVEIATATLLCCTCQFKLAPPAGDQDCAAGTFARPAPAYCGPAL